MNIHADDFPEGAPPPQVEEQPRSLRSIVKDDSRMLARRLAEHQAANFPPNSAKTFRRLAPGEAACILGVTESYLRQLAPPAPNRERRTFSLEDLAKLRQTLAAKSRPAGKYLPHRSASEKLQVVAIMNFKGGSAKTTTAAHFAQHLALSGYRTLAVDLDPQASLTTLHGLNELDGIPSGTTMFGAIQQSGALLPTTDIIRKTFIPFLDIIPASLELQEFEFQTPTALMDAQNKRAESRPILNRVDAALTQVTDQYDVIVIDCPPQLGYLAISALMASTSVLVTVHPQMLDVASLTHFLEMLGDLFDVIVNASGGTEVNYEWFRYLITRYKPSDGPQTQMTAFLRSLFKERVLVHPAIESSAIANAGLTNQTLYEIDRREITRSTYDRAMDSIKTVNEELDALIRKTWGRA